MGVVTPLEHGEEAVMRCFSVGHKELAVTDQVLSANCARECRRTHKASEEQGIKSIYDVPQIKNTKMFLITSLA
jgi:hypothetical protein